MKLLDSQSNAEESQPDPRRPTQVATASEFPQRAEWLRDRLRERAWDHNEPYRHSGPDRKTIDKILVGKRVREEMLGKLAIALSRKHSKVDVMDIPTS